MKIVHVLSGLTKGGGERIVVELANQGIKSGDQVTVLAGWPEDPALLQQSIDSQVEIKFIAATKRKAYLRLITWIIFNKRWLAGFDVLHCHLSFGALFGFLTK